MKFLVLVSMIGVACAARLENTYIPPSSASSAGGYNLEVPKQAFASNIQNQYQAPGNNFQQQQVNRPGLNQGTFTSQSAGKGFQSVQAGSYSSNQGSYQQPQQNYNQQASQSSYNSNAQQGSYQAPQQQNYNQQQSYNNGPSTTPIPILKYENVPHTGDGSYRFEYLTGNGIMAQEEGYLNNPSSTGSEFPEQVAVGSYSYTAPDGQLISLSYKADGQGFVPVGAHLPVAPELPAEYYEQVALQKKIADEIEEEGRKILALQAQQARERPQQQQQNYNQQQSYNNNAQQQSYNNNAQQGSYQQPQQGSYQQPQVNYNQQASNQVFQQQRPQAQAQSPQKTYLPPGQSYGK